MPVLAVYCRRRQHADERDEHEARTKLSCSLGLATACHQLRPAACQSRSSIHTITNRTASRSHERVVHIGPFTIHQGITRVSQRSGHPYDRRARASTRLLETFFEAKGAGVRRHYHASFRFEVLPPQGFSLCVTEPRPGRSLILPPAFNVIIPVSHRLLPFDVVMRTGQPAICYHDRSAQHRPRCEKNATSHWPIDTPTRATSARRFKWHRRDVLSMRNPSGRLAHRQLLDLSVT